MAIQSILISIIRNNYFWISPTSPMGFLANGENIRIEQLVKVEAMYGFEFAKVLISLAKGKKTYDKRQVIKERENKINLDRLKKI